jgi:hypothetical protein
MRRIPRDSAGAGGSAWLLAALLVLQGCSTFSERIAQVESRLVAGDFAAAATALERVDFPERDQALLLLNRGMIARYRGDPVASNRDLEAAKQRMDTLAALSVREVALASTVTEQAGAYAGQPFERLLVPVFKAFNYLDLGDLDAARVEALQIDLLLREFTESRDEAAVAGSAFARYATGLVYELGGERSDAFIAYRKAAESYARMGPLPALLAEDLARLAADLGRNADLPAGVEPLKGSRTGRPPTELAVLVTAGLAPALREEAVVVPEPISGRLMRIALPSLRPRHSGASGFRLLAGEAEREGVAIADMLGIAKRDLDDRLPGMTARLVARQVVKSQLVRQASKSAMSQANDSGERIGAGLLAIGAELTALLTERADTRSWLSLPGDVYLARVALPPGRHEIRVSLHGPYNEVAGSRSLATIDMQAGDRRWLSLHWPG